jgi:DNA adenine methylase
MNSRASVAVTTRPILRWAGSKAQILDRLAQFWLHDEALYIEPFCGSAALFLKLSPKKAILGDLNLDLIETYRVIRLHPERVFRAISKWPKTPDHYYNVRKLNSRALSRVQRAARFIYLNRLCFNGLYRTNLKGEFNVPWGADGAGQFPSAEQFKLFSDSLRTARLVHADFQRTLAYARSGSFVYMDPPYRVSKTRTFKEYMPSGFGSTDLERLRLSLEDLHARGALFLLSYADSEEAAVLASGFETTRLPVKRFIAGSASKRMSVDEVLITNIKGII